MRKITVLGTGCPKCAALTESVSSRVKALGLDADVEKVTDMQTIASYGIMNVPAIVIDGRVVHAGGVPDDKKLDEILTGEEKARACHRSCGCCGEEE